MESREPKRFEDEKKVMLIKGANANLVVTKLMKDIFMLKKPNSVFFGRKNDFHPFDNQSNIEFFSKKNDCPLFAFGSNTKKRPNNLILGRTFNYQVLDMLEFGVENFKALDDFKTAKVSLNSKPIILVSGQAFAEREEYRRIHNLFVDLFSAHKHTKINLNSIEHVIYLIAHEEKILFRSYRIGYQKSGLQTPRVELEEIGPHFDLTLRRQRLASKDLFKKACFQPFSLKPNKVKNVQKTALGDTLGRVHMDRQDYVQLATRKFKGTRPDKRPLDSEPEHDTNDLDEEMRQDMKDMKRIKFSSQDFDQDEQFSDDD